LDVDDVSVEGFRTYYFRVARTLFAGWGSVKRGKASTDYADSSQPPVASYHPKSSTV